MILDILEMYRVTPENEMIISHTIDAKIGNWVIEYSEENSDITTIEIFESYEEAQTKVKELIK